ncbi:MAG: rRNA maturation RNase YbeY [Bdellovibrionales bacterium]|nr:rRNA maturation RNase YbeY [Bdellovibrionales bacterium]
MAYHGFMPSQTRISSEISDELAQRELRRIVRVLKRSGENSGKSSRALLGRFQKSIGGLPPIQITVALVTDATMKALNARYRGKGKTTDILSFSAPLALQKLGQLGELVISKGALKRQAEDHGHSQKTELRILLVHGVVHLLGFDHERDSKEFDAQQRAEQMLFRLLGWKLSGLMKRAPAR